MKEIINLSLGSPTENFDEMITVLNRKFRIRKFGVDFNVALMKKLIIKYKDNADIFTISGFAPEIVINSTEYLHNDLVEMQELAHPIPLVYGKLHRDAYQPWFVDRLVNQIPELFDGKKVGFFAGAIQRNILKELEKLNCKINCADPYFFYKMPLLLKSSRAVENFLKLNINLLVKCKIKKLRSRDFSKKSLNRNVLFRDFFDCDVFFLNSSQLEYIKLQDLSGKIIVLENVTPNNKKMLEDAGVKRIISVVNGSLGLPELNVTVLEAIFYLIHGEDNTLNSADFIDYMEQLNLSPQIDSESEKIALRSELRDKFSFIVHPLSIKDLFYVPALKPLGRFKHTRSLSEKILKHAPGFYYGKIQGVKSEFNGKEIQGDIYTILDTPKMMMKSNKEHIYKKLCLIAGKAKSEGSKLLGLGAYTKVVGDAGVTVAKRSPIPVTTGNSLSAASTLWAANYAISKMNFVKKKKGRYNGTVMIIGATGSIGKVCSKVLAQSWTHVIIVAPRPYKLVDLNEEILEIAPSAQITYSTKPEEYLPICDLVITTTSAQGRKILDIDYVKPGAVICDVSRPFDIGHEDSLKRPDVLVIASGEVELPGDNVRLTCDIGLPGSTVYACLAETALLTLEGRFENFSLSRDINYKKVIEIDAMARKHGVRLSAIMGHDVEITDEEMRLCRKHALKRMKTWDTHELRI